MMSNFLRKLIFGGGLAAGAFVLSKTGGTDPAMTMAITTSLMAAVGGNLAHESFNIADEGVSNLLAKVTARPLEIDQNHHITRQLRRSWLRALTVLKNEFGKEVFSDSDRYFFEGLENYLYAAGQVDRLLPQSDMTEIEKSVFGQLPEALQQALAASGNDAVTNSTAAKITARLVQSALEELTAEIGYDVPHGFRALACREENGLIDLYVRDVADALRHNHDFKAIWDTQALAHIETALKSLRGWLSERFQAMDTRFDEVLHAISREKGVPVEHLKPILEKLGRTDTPETDYAKVLSQAVDELLAPSVERVFPSNDGAEVEAAIVRAREKLKTLDTAGAISELDKALDGDEAYFAAAYRRACLLEEKAFILFNASEPDKALALYQQAQVIYPIDEDKLANLLTELGRTLWFRGQITHSERFYRAVSDMFERRLSQSPEDVVAQRWVSNVLSQIGDLLIQRGETERGLGCHERALSMAEQLAREDNDPQAHLRVCYMLNSLGEALMRRGDLAGALERYEKAWSLAEQLDEGLLNAFSSIILNNIGDVLRHRGDLEGALERYDQSLAIGEQCAQNEGNWQAQRKVSITLCRIGDILMQRGDFEGAQIRYERSLLIAEQLEKHNSNAVFQQDVSFSLYKIGDILMWRGDYEAALEHYERSLSIYDELAQHEGNADAQRWVSILLTKVGDIFMLRGDFAGAQAHFERSLSIAESLAQDKSDARAQRDVSLSLGQLGNCLRQRGDFAGAQAYCERSLLIAESLAKDKSDAWAQRDVMLALTHLAYIHNDRVSWTKLMTHLQTMRLRGQLDPMDTSRIQQAQFRLARVF